MENNELKKISIKNHKACYFNKIIKFEDFDFEMLLDEKSYENILIYDNSYKTLISAKPLHILFDRVDEFIRDYDGAKYLVLFGFEYNVTYDKFGYLIGLIGLKSSIKYVFSYNHAKIKIVLDYYLHLQETLA